MSVFVTLLFCNILLCSARKNDKKHAKCFDDVCLKAGYSPDTAPSSNNNRHILVDMQFSLENILSVDHDHNTIGLTVSLRQTWIDNRVYTKKSSLLKNGGWMAVPTKMGRDPETGIPQYIWMPKFYIYFLLKMEIKTNYQQQTLIWISKEKNNLYVNYDSLFDLYLKCPMKYDHYPFDEHECPVKFSSADFNSTRLLFNMSIDAKWGRLKNTLGQFGTEIIPLEKHELMDTWEGEDWSICGFKLLLRRKHWKYVFSYYMTSGLFVIISWVSFLIPTKDVNARMGLLITILLVLVTVYNSVIEMSPKARDNQTALAAWMFSMLLFVCLAFLFHCISMIWRKSKDTKKALIIKRRKKSLLPIDGRTMMGFDTRDHTVYPTEMFQEKTKSGLKTKLFQKVTDNHSSHTIDFIIILILITIFIVYVLMYWVIYK